MFSLMLAKKWTQQRGGVNQGGFDPNGATLYSFLVLFKKSLNVCLLIS